MPGNSEPLHRRSAEEKFREEGKLLSKLSEHPAVVRVFDFGTVSNCTGMFFEGCLSNCGLKADACRDECKDHYDQCKSNCAQIY